MVKYILQIMLFFREKTQCNKHLLVLWTSYFVWQIKASIDDKWL